MALAVFYEWIVTINDRWKYQVEAPFCAEAQHEAVCLWRKDLMLSLEDRTQRITTMVTEELARLSTRPGDARLGSTQLVVPTTRRPQAQHLPLGRQRAGEQAALCGANVVPWPDAGQYVLPVCVNCERRSGRLPRNHG